MSLIELCKNYDFDSVKKLLEKLGGDANLEETDEEGNTALLIAADCEDIEVVQLLIKAGCNVNHQNDE
jgi:ankyrin repeat protein